MPSDPLRAWSAALAAVVITLALSAAVQECFHRALMNAAAPGIPMDFPHYYAAGRLVRQAPPGNILYYPVPGRAPRSYLDLRFDASTPYGLATGGLPAGTVTRPFDAPPFAALLMEPFARLPWQRAYLALQLTSIALLGVSIYLALGLFTREAPSALAAAIAVASALIFMPVNRSVGYGNIDVAMLFLWVVGLWFLSRRRLAPSAFCLELGTAIKVTPAFAVPFFILRRQWKWLAWYAASSAALLAYSLWRVGWQNNHLWISSVAPALAGGMTGFYNRSLMGLLYALTAPHTLALDLPGSPRLFLLAKLMSLAVYAAFLAACWRKSRSSGQLLLELSLLPLVVLLISPLSWPQHYVLALLPLVVLWTRARQRAASVSKLELALLACCTLLLGSALPEFAARALGPAAELLLMAAWVAATFALLFVGMRLPADQPEHAESLAAAPNHAVASAVIAYGSLSDSKERA